MRIEWLRQAWLETLGWTLVHSLWELSLVAAVAVVLLMVLRRGSAQVRYVVGYGVLMGMMVVPVGTYGYLWARRVRVVAVVGVSAGVMRDSPVFVGGGEEVMSQVELMRVGTWERVMGWLRAVPPYAAMGYLVGAGLLTLRLLAGYGALRRVRTGALAAREHEALLRELCGRLRVGVAVRLMQSARVEVPTVIGAWRPMILLPVSAMTGLSAEHLTYLLLHELAHIRRHDYLANLAQSMVETLLFYHPAVVWLSGQVRQEREHCCDDVAVMAAGNRGGYAAALASMEGLRAEPEGVRGGLVIGARGGSLLQRVQRILQSPVPISPDQRLACGLSVLVICAVLATGLYFVGCERSPAAPSPKGNPTAEDLPATKIDLQAERVPLETVFNELSKEYKLNLVVNWTALEEARVNKTTEVTLHLSNIPFNKALEILSENLGALAPIDADENQGVMIISTRQSLDEHAKMIVHTYDVRDLLIQPENFMPSLAQETPEKTDGITPQNMKARAAAAIVHVIEETILPESWVDNGGPQASISEFQGQLVVKQIPRAQILIANLLDTLRHVQETQIAIEARIMFVDDNTFASLQLPSIGPPVILLKEDKIAPLLKDITGNPNTISVSSPRLTLFSGQAGFIQVGVTGAKQGSRIRLNVQAAASADRHSVILNLEPSLSESGAEAQKLSGSFAVPDGNVVLMGGLLAKNDGKDKSEQRRMIVLVRAKIIEEKETDKAAFGPKGTP
jgi:beta-lactamase regulating signal transducer with metallopeptidase domain